MLIVIHVLIVRSSQLACCRYLRFLKARVATRCGWGQVYYPGENMAFTQWIFQADKSDKFLCELFSFSSMDANVRIAS